MRTSHQQVQPSPISPEEEKGTPGSNLNCPSGPWLPPRAAAARRSSTPPRALPVPAWLLPPGQAVLQKEGWTLALGQLQILILNLIACWLGNRDKSPLSEPQASPLCIARAHLQGQCEQRDDGVYTEAMKLGSSLPAPVTDPVKKVFVD